MSRKETITVFDVMSIALDEGNNTIVRLYNGVGIVIPSYTKIELEFFADDDPGETGIIIKTK